MTHTELFALIHHLELIFDTVRLINSSITYQYSISENGDITMEPYQCYEIWGKDCHCENCIADKAFSRKGKVAKLEWMDHDVYHVVAKYIEADGVPYVLEMISRIEDKALFGTCAKPESVSLITACKHHRHIGS